MNPQRRRKLLIKKCEHLLLKMLMVERGNKCEICGKKKILGLFHILPKGKYPRLRFYKENLLIAGWYCCHYQWHHDYYESRDRIAPRIKQLRGDDYEEKIAKVGEDCPKLTEAYLTELLLKFEKELTKLCQKKKRLKKSS